MKYPKHRGNLYIVLRNTTPIGACRTLEGADYLKSATEQLFKEKGFTEDKVVISITLVNYYDE